MKKQALDKLNEYLKGWNGTDTIDVTNFFPLIELKDGEECPFCTEERKERALTNAGGIYACMNCDIIKD